ASVRSRAPASAQASSTAASTRGTRAAVCSEKRRASVLETAARRSAAARQRARARRSVEEGGSDIVDRADGVRIVGERPAHRRGARAPRCDPAADQLARVDQEAGARAFRQAALAEVADLLAEGRQAQREIEIELTLVSDDARLEVARRIAELERHE